MVLVDRGNNPTAGFGLAVIHFSNRMDGNDSRIQPSKALAFCGNKTADRSTCTQPFRRSALVLSDMPYLRSMISDLILRCPSKASIALDLVICFLD